MINAFLLRSTRNVESGCTYANTLLKYDHTSINTNKLRYKA